jgi:hypothetical protein
VTGASELPDDEALLREALGLPDAVHGDALRQMAAEKLKLLSPTDRLAVSMRLGTLADERDAALAGTPLESKDFALTAGLFAVLAAGSWFVVLGTHWAIAEKVVAGFLAVVFTVSALRAMARASHIGRR